MAEKVLMIALSPTMDEGTLVKWNKQEGDSIESGDVLCEVETDKAAMDYESTEEGTLLKIVVGEGGKAAVGDCIAIIGEEGEDISDLEEEAASEKEGKAEDTDDTDSGQQQEEQLDDEDKAPDDEDKDSNREKKDPDQEDKGGDDGQSDDDDGRIKASPLARKLAKKHGIPLKDLEGSGPRGRIVKADIEKAQAEDEKSDAHDGTTREEDKRIAVSGRRRVIAQRLAESKFSAPHYYLKVSVCADGLIQARKSLNNTQKEKVSFNAFLIKFAAEALKRHPVVNSSWKGDTILRHGSMDIGLAVALEDGLITPVVRNCGEKGIVAIEAELQELIEKARNNKLKPDEFQNATFTISNLGSFGIEEFTAIINPPGSAILAVGESRRVPVVSDDGDIEPRTMMKLTLSCDHRVIDGAVGAAFLKMLKDIIENPVHALY